MNNEELDLAVKRIMKLYEIIDQQDIPLAVNRNKGYISQIKSRKHIPKDFIDLLQLKYPKAFTVETNNSQNNQQGDIVKELLSMLRVEQENVGKAHDALKKEQENLGKAQDTIKIYAMKEAPDITEAAKNGSANMKKLKPVK